MSGSQQGARSAQNLPYQPRTRTTPKKPGSGNRKDGEDVEATNAFEEAQAFASPPPPPPSMQSAKPPSPLPPPQRKSSVRVTADHINPFRSQLPEAMIPPMTLTPLRAHYLKKTLVNLQMAHELNLLTDPVLGSNALGLLGDPFVLPEAAKTQALERVSEIAKVEGRVGDLPFMRFLFHQFLLPFPFLTGAPPTFWSAKVQPFLSSFLATTGYTKQSGMSAEERKMAEALMSPEERKELEERNKLWAKSEKHLALMVGVGIKIVGGEEVVRIGQAELRRLELAQEERRQKRIAKKGNQQLPPPPTQDGVDPNDPSPTFDVNVVGVRVVVEKGRVRNKSHDVSGLWHPATFCSSLVPSFRSSLFERGRGRLVKETSLSLGGMETLSVCLTR